MLTIDAQVHAYERNHPGRLWAAFLHGPLARIFDAFGIGRCMWGTDWTRAVGLLTYKQGVDAFRVTDRLSDGDKATLMAGTLQRVYKWSLKTA